MKILTLWEPWASLMAASVKKIETRSWGTSYRGPIAIHAAKRVPTPEEWQRVKDDLRKCWGMGFLNPENRKAGERPLGETLGRILCVVDLIDCREMLESPCPQEALFGSFGPGRFGWVTDVARLFVLPEPIAMAGRQGLKDLPESVAAQIEQQRSHATRSDPTRKEEPFPDV